ncbi:glycosyl hydrolase [Kineococcus terrestris]|uniref:glycosyl hydrolase n=1 Tax=Kineococcus terrestris TaxID=2044856 RepID=UPI0034DB425C
MPGTVHRLTRSYGSIPAGQLVIHQPGGQPTPQPESDPLRRTFLLVHAHDTAAVGVDAMATEAQRSYEGVLLFNDVISQASQISSPWFLRTDAPYPRWWRTQNPTVRRRFVVTQAPMVGTDAASVISGSLDSAITSCLAAIRTAFGDQAIVRLGHEANTHGAQYPWGNTRTSAADYKAVWRRWVNLARAGGFPFQFEFTSMLDGTPLADWYPGDDIVDIVGLDAYGSKWKSTNPSESELVAWVKTQAPNSIEDLTAFCASHNKPFAFSEWSMFSWQKPLTNASGAAVSDSRGSGDHASYVDAIFDTIAAYPVTSGSNVYCAYHSLWNVGDGGVGTTLEGRDGSLAMPNIRARYYQRVRALHPA